MSEPRRDVPLAPLTTLGVGGPARLLADVAGPDDVADALRLAAERDLPTLVLGGGSNLLVADAGFPGLVLRPTSRGLRCSPDGRVEVAAGEPWDAAVKETVERGLAGIECLSGIPGCAGAAPIQNIGAYGQEVAEVVEEVIAVERATGAPVRFSAAGCDFAYRHSRFKAAPTHVVVGLVLRLRPGGAPTIRYAELARALGESPTLARTRDAVLALRRGKSMVLDPADPNRRSAGSFFLNPVVPADEADRVRRLAPEGMPCWPAGDSVKLSAAWLIERAGMPRGFGDGPVGLSTRHTLAVVNRGGATAADVVRFASEVRRRVHERFGVLLQPEPVPVGFTPEELAPLTGAHTAPDPSA